MSVSEAKWYIIHTYSGYENKVMTNLLKTVENNGLQDLIYDVKVPMEETIEVKNGKKKHVQRKLFPGYVMVKMLLTDESWYVVRNTRGCTGFLGQDKSGGSKPIPLTEEEIIAMGVEKREIEVNYAAGDSVRVIDGALAGFINGFFGAGGGMVLVPLLIWLCRLEDKAAFSSAIAVILPLCIVSIVVYALHDSLPISDALPYLIGGAAGGILAGLLFRKMSAKALHLILGAVILAGGIRLIVC